MRHCCKSMRRQIKHLSICDDPFHCHQAVIYYNPRFDEYGIIVHGKKYVIRMNFCPFCGAKLPESKYTLWLKTLKAMGLKDVDAFSVLRRKDIPKEFLTDEWYRKKSRRNQGEAEKSRPKRRKGQGRGDKN
jgi:hypothetical protein